MHTMRPRGHATGDKKRYFWSTNSLNHHQLFTLIDVSAFWQEHRTANGGNYLCAHLRRADFLYGREETTPTLRSAATQILHKLKELQLRTVFVSSDCSGQEYRSFKSFLSRYQVTRFQPSSAAERTQLKPGGIAIVDQIICSHARYFMGTFESTFTYRIYEEREILGFPSETTFNTLCRSPNKSDECFKNSVWPIAFWNLSITKWIKREYIFTFAFDKNN